MWLPLHVKWALPAQIWRLDWAAVKTCKLRIWMLQAAVRLGCQLPSHWEIARQEHPHNSYFPRHLWCCCCIPPGTATNVAVQLEGKSEEPYGNGKTSTINFADATDGKPTWDLQTRAFSKSGGVTPGTISSVITMSFAYNSSCFVSPVYSQNMILFYFWYTFDTSHWDR